MFMRRHHAYRGTKQAFHEVPSVQNCPAILIQDYMQKNKLCCWQSFVVLALCKTRFGVKSRSSVCVKTRGDADSEGGCVLARGLCCVLQEVDLDGVSWR